MEMFLLLELPYIQNEKKTKIAKVRVKVQFLIQYTGHGMHVGDFRRYMNLIQIMQLGADVMMKDR